MCTSSMLEKHLISAMDAASLMGSSSADARTDGEHRMGITIVGVCYSLDAPRGSSSSERFHDFSLAIIKIGGEPDALESIIREFHRIKLRRHYNLASFG
ncbi:uncharacterized protein [Aegilops tauschii subsp. strangulata]|uniref:uncharacterized protein n=1 Tax=Aegilops tauschii subsp. strangulata TaxID=200361 RepID=UPI003CC89C91